MVRRLTCFALMIVGAAAAVSAQAVGGVAGWQRMSWPGEGLAGVSLEFGRGPVSVSTEGIVGGEQFAISPEAAASVTDRPAGRTGRTFNLVLDGVAVTGLAGGFGLFCVGALLSFSDAPVDPVPGSTLIEAGAITGSVGLAAVIVRLFRGAPFPP